MHRTLPLWSVYSLSKKEIISISSDGSETNQFDSKFKTFHTSQQKNEEMTSTSHIHATSVKKKTSVNQIYVDPGRFNSFA